MGERERQLERDTTDVGVSVDALDESESTGSRQTSSRRDRLRSRAANVFSVRSFLLTLVVALVGFLVAGALPLVGGVTSLLGIAAATFATGAVASQSRYFESAMAGASVVGVATFLDYVAPILGGFGLPIVAVGVASGLIAAVVGHYFGRDLRHGLTRDV